MDKLEKIQDYFSTYRKKLHEGNISSEFFQQIVDDLQGEIKQQPVVDQLENYEELTRLNEAMDRNMKLITALKQDKQKLASHNEELIARLRSEKEPSEDVDRLRSENKTLLEERDELIAEMNSINNKYISALNENEKLSQDNDIFYNQMSDKERSISDLHKKIELLKLEHEDRVSKLEEKIKTLIPVPKKTVQPATRMPSLIKVNQVRKSSIGGIKKG